LAAIFQVKNFFSKCRFQVSFFQVKKVSSEIPYLAHFTSFFFFFLFPPHLQYRLQEGDSAGGLVTVVGTVLRKRKLGGIAFVDMSFAPLDRAQIVAHIASKKRLEVESGYELLFHRGFLGQDDGAGGNPIHSLFRLFVVGDTVECVGHDTGRVTNRGHPIVLVVSVRALACELPEANRRVMLDVDLGGGQAQAALEVPTVLPVDAGRDAATLGQFLRAQPTPTQSICWAWRTQGACDCPGSCADRHHFLSDEEEMRYRHSPGEALGREADDPWPEEHKAPHGRRARVFAAWLVETYGELLRAPGALVLDIAGGKGHVSCHLVGAIPTLECLVIDPKCDKNGRAAKGRPRSVMAVPAIFDHRLFSDPEVAPLLARATLVIGFHPDEATELIWDWARRQAKLPCAIVPCCVFAYRFPNRALKDGSPVRSSSDLCNYYHENEPASKTAFLNVQGRNKVVYVC
jgi:hypothetical protein